MVGSVSHRAEQGAGLEPTALSLPTLLWSECFLGRCQGSATAGA